MYLQLLHFFLSMLQYQFLNTVVSDQQIAGIKNIRESITQVAAAAGKDSSSIQGARLTLDPELHFSTPLALLASWAQTLSLSPGSLQSLLTCLPASALTLRTRVHKTATVTLKLEARSRCTSAQDSAMASHIT